MKLFVDLRVSYFLITFPALVNTIYAKLIFIVYLLVSSLYRFL